MIASGIPFAGLAQETAREVAPLLVPREWQANSILFREGEPCAGLHLVEYGTVKLYTASGTGREQIVHLVGEPGPLTLTPLVDGREYPASACALTKARTLFLPRPEFDRFFHTHTDFAGAVAKELARRVRATIRITETIALKQVPARVASRILENARAAGAVENREAFRMVLNQEEMARLLGTSRESVARAFGELRRAGVIEQRGANVRILNAAALIRWIKESDPACVAHHSAPRADSLTSRRGEDGR